MYVKKKTQQKKIPSKQKGMAKFDVFYAMFSKEKLSCLEITPDNQN